VQAGIALHIIAFETHFYTDFNHRYTTSENNDIIIVNVLSLALLESMKLHDRKRAFRLTDEQKKILENGLDDLISSIRSGKAFKGPRSASTARRTKVIKNKASC
jgi:hypothetical protein